MDSAHGRGLLSSWKRICDCLKEVHTMTQTITHLLMGHQIRMKRAHFQMPPAPRTPPFLVFAVLRNALQIITLRCTILRLTPTLHSLPTSTITLPHHHTFHIPMDCCPIRSTTVNTTQVPSPSPQHTVPTAHWYNTLPPLLKSLTWAHHPPCCTAMVEVAPL